MKKTLSVLLIAGVFSASMIACKKDKAVDCDGINKTMTDAATAYGTNPTSANCSAYKKALQDYMNSSCAGSLTQTQKDQYNLVLTMMPCQ